MTYRILLPLDDKGIRLLSDVIPMSALTAGGVAGALCSMTWLRPFAVKFDPGLQSLVLLKMGGSADEFFLFGVL